MTIEPNNVTPTQTKIETSTRNLPATIAAAPVPMETPLGRVLTYQDANPEQRAVMDGIKAKLNIEDENTILLAGSEVLQKISSLSQEITNSIIMDGQEDAWGISVQKMTTALEACTPEKLAEKPSGIIGTAVATIRSAASQVLGRDPEAASSRQMLSKLRENLGNAEETIGAMAQTLENQIGSIDRNHERIMRMGKMMQDAALELQIISAAVGEFKREVYEQTLPAAQAQYEKTGLSLDAQKRDTVLMNAELLGTHDADLVGSCSNAIALAHVLNRARLINRRSYQQTKGHLLNSVAVWHQGLAAFGILNKELVHRSIIRDANAMTDAAIRNNAEVFGHLVKDTARTSKRGTFDLGVVMEANARILQAFKEAAQIEAESSATLQQVVDAAKTTTAAFHNLANKMETARLTGDAQALADAGKGVDRVQGIADKYSSEVTREDTQKSKALGKPSEPGVV